MTHEKFMHRAIELAQRASGNTSPNPLVGAVIVRDNKIIAEGWHREAGLAHAEVDAINQAKTLDQSTQGATMYVSLEPCSHHGKTPPCTQAVLDAGISTLIYATSDTNTDASGGADILSSAGIKVIGGVCEELARENNRFFFHYLQNNTPFVIAKFASSLDGRTATRTGNSQWITGQQARKQGHVARQAVDAILIGAQTAIDDEPQLTVRNPDAYPHTTASHPLRIVLDSQGRVNTNNAVFNNSLPSNTLVVSTNAMPKEHANKLQAAGVEILTLPCSKGSTQPDLTLLLQELGNRGIQSLLVEGGNTVLGSFIDKQLVNEVWAFIAPMIIGGTNAAPSVGGMGIDQLAQAPRLTNLNVDLLDNDLFIRGQIAPSSTDTGAL